MGALQALFVLGMCEKGVDGMQFVPYVGFRNKRRGRKMTLNQLMKAEDEAWKALMNDPRVLADPEASHTPEIKARWEAAADAEYAYRQKHGL